jgi:hypothetical protein
MKFVSFVGVMVIAACGAGCAADRGVAVGGESPWRKIQQNTGASFVSITYYSQKVEPTRPDARGGPDAEARMAMDRIFNDITVETTGVIISDTGEVFTTERELQYPQTVSKITITGWDGKTVQVKPDRLLLKAPGRILRITEKMPETWKALKFADCDPAKITPDASFYAAALRGDEKSRVAIRPCEFGLGWGSGTRDAVIRIGGVDGFVVLCDEQGRPIGLTMIREIDPVSSDFAWRGADILADKGLTMDEQTRLEEKIKKEFARNIYEVTITFRPRPSEDGRGRFMDEGGYDGGLAVRESLQERLTYALAFADTHLLVPGVLSRVTVEGIDTISVKVDGKPMPCRFAGVLRTCEAMVIELQEGQLPASLPFAADAHVAKVEPFWTVGARDLAGMDVETDWARWVFKEQGFGDKWYPMIDRSIATGSWLLDHQGRLVGYFGRTRRELDRLQGYLFAEDSRYAASRRGATAARPYAMVETTRLFDAADMAKMLSADPAVAYDTHIRHLDKEQQKRRTWLGVEYTRPSKEMVKQMNLRQQTQDGRIGLVVNRIYPGSPAARMGLAEGDILLRLRVPEAPWSIDLSTNERATYEMPSDDEEGDVPEEFRTIGYRSRRSRPWPSRDNYLTRMLGDIGAGATVKLMYIHDGQQIEKDFAIEQAPPDMLAAAKYKNDKLGLTVKDMTYEVRAALHLNENDNAVVVTEIEPGTAAAMARVSQYELIRAVDGEAVDSVGTFEKLVADAQKTQKESVRVTVEWMGKTRLADLKFNAKPTGPAAPRSLSSGVGGADQ